MHILRCQLAEDAIDDSYRLLLPGPLTSGNGIPEKYEGIVMCVPPNNNLSVRLSDPTEHVQNVLDIIILAQNNAEEKKRGSSLCPDGF